MKTCLLLLIIALLAACKNDNKTAQKHIPGDTNIITVNNDSNNIISGKDSSDFSAGSIEAVANKLIVPGEKIGKAMLNADADSIEAIFGKPDMSDAAMGKAWLTWYGKKTDAHNNKTQLDIYTAYKDTGMREKKVQQIRTTSSYFNTENNIHVYSSFNEVQNAFPLMHKVKQSKEDEAKTLVYDDVKDGIAFEFGIANDQKICTGIFVHNKGRKVTDIYINPPAQ